MSRNNKLTDLERAEIINRYIAGESSNFLGREHGVSSTAILQLLRTRGVARRPPPSTSRYSAEEQKAICARYEAGESASAIAKVMGVAVSTVTRILKRNNCEQRTRAEIHRRYEADHSFFRQIDTERKAYWLGFIAADGYINATGKGSGAEIILRLSILDEAHLYLLRKHIQSNHPITRYTLKSPKSSKTYWYARFALRSRELASGLATHSVTQAKTYSLRWPRLPKHLLNHYLRGYMDGDGGFYITSPLKPGYRQKLVFRITSNVAFLADAQKFLIENASLSYTKIHEHRISPGIGTLIWNGNLQVARIFDLVYRDATVWLPRKYDKVKHLVVL